MVFSTTIQQSISYVFVAILAIGAVVWLLANLRRAKPEVGSEVELAPNRKRYFDDDEMEGRRMERFQLWGLGCLAIVAVGLPLYWLVEPGRQRGAVEYFDDTFAKRGSHLYATTAEGGFNCAGCHGGASGAPVNYTVTDQITKKIRQVSWKAPSLDDVTLRMTDEQIRYVLTYGRPFSPMPAWGIAGGGPMNEQQIDNLIAYLHSISITPKEAKERQAEEASAELAILEDPEAALETAKASAAEATDTTTRLAAQAEVKRIESIIANGQTASLGAALFNLNCARCHTAGYSYGEVQAPGSGAMGPSLFDVLSQFVVAQDHIDFVTSGKKLGEKYGNQGTSTLRMPYFGQILTADQITAIVEYERELAQQRQVQK
jgi:mono/diheme cytochrome c family protein